MDRTYHIAASNNEDVWFAEKLFASFGITVTDAISIFLRKSIMEGGLPFEMKQPRYNAETKAALTDVKTAL